MMWRGLGRRASAPLLHCHYIIVSEGYTATCICQATMRFELIMIAHNVGTKTKQTIDDN